MFLLFQMMKFLIHTTEEDINLQTTDQIIDEILLKSPYGAKAYEDRQKRRNEKDAAKNIEDEIIDHPQQTYFNFEEDKNE